MLPKVFKIDNVTPSLTNMSSRKATSSPPTLELLLKNPYLYRFKTPNRASGIQVLKPIKALFNVYHGDLKELSENKDTIKEPVTDREHES